MLAATREQPKLTSMAHLIIGHTTESTARIWIRGNRKRRRCNVVLQPGDDLEKLVRCEEGSDYTGIVDFERLTPGIEYTVTATFSPESEVVHGRFCTPDVPLNGTPLGFSFVLSSCNLSVVSINNFLAFLLATTGTSVANTSLENQPDRWNAPRFMWLRRLWRWALKKSLYAVAGLVNTTTGIKQPGPAYLRSPFLKLAAIFDGWILDVEPHRDPHVAVGDVLVSSGASGLIAARFLPEDPNHDKSQQKTHGPLDTKAHPPNPAPMLRLVVVPTEGQFREGPLCKQGSPDKKSGNHDIYVGEIKKVWRAKPWYERPSFFIHAGDQIYYDFPDGDREPDRDKYRLAYREAWFDDEPNRYLLSHWPHYMTLDDHEIADQFALDFEPPGKAEASMYLDEARIAYQEYVALLRPPPASAGAAPRERVGPFWYTFQRLVFEASPDNKRYTRFFVLDTRTQRRTHGAARQMIDDYQMRQLLGWMKRYKDDLKFVVTSVPFVAEISEAGSKKTPRWPHKTSTSNSLRAPRANDPATDSGCAEGSSERAEGSDRGPRNPLNDKWSAAEFARQRGEIIEFIAEHGIEQLVFLTGDMHCCYHAMMRIGSASKYESIVIHELAGGPVNQLQLADIREFNRFCSRRTTGQGVEYEVALDRFHSEVNGVLHLKVNYEKRDQVTGQEQTYTPEVEWNVIRTLTETEQSAWSEERLSAAGAPVEQPSPADSSPFSAGEPVMHGRISFTKKRTPSDLRPWD
jgi:PhoD-like phosphatase